MTYSRILTPRFYIDTPNWLMSRGVAADQFAVKTGSDLIDHDSDFVDAELFDMKPANQVVFSTKDSSATRADHVLIVIDKQATSLPTDFVAILNHNCNSADAKFRIAGSGSDITAIDPTAVACSELFNADDSSDIFTPDNDGDSIVTFGSASNARYIAIQFEGSDSGSFDSTNDLKIGCLVFGEFYTMNNSPDLSVKRSISFDGVDVVESTGGKRFSNASWLEGNQTATTQSGQPFRHEGTSYVGRQGGRMSYDMNFSYMADTNLLPESMTTSSWTGESVFGDVWNRTGGRLTPFIFTPDSTSTTAGDYMFGRFSHDSLNLSQVAHNTWNVSVSIDEEF